MLILRLPQRVYGRTFACTKSEISSESSDPARAQKCYEEFWALKDVSFEVPTGTTFGVIGHNGSGKSTLLKTLTGILVPDQGSVTTAGAYLPYLNLVLDFIQSFQVGRMCFSMVRFSG